jgi:hypothetical protein
VSDVERNRYVRKSLITWLSLIGGFAVTLLIFLPIQQARANHAAAMADKSVAAYSAQQDQINQQSAANFAVQERKMQERLQVLMFQRDCTTDGAHWFRDHPHAFPASMVIQPTNTAGQWTWDLVVRPWSKTPGPGVVRMLCVK